VTDRDDLDGCQVLLDGESRVDPTDDRDVPWLVLFASRLDRDAIRRVRTFRVANDGS
jgi:hypothetical protein